MHSLTQPQSKQSEASSFGWLAQIANLYMNLKYHIRYSNIEVIILTSGTELLDSSMSEYCNDN